METGLSLPAPSAAALAHSNRLLALIRERIGAADGWLSFADYMELALYAPGLGYYSAGSAKLGPAGDFITAPELGSLFAGSLARLCRTVLGSLGGGVIFELGSGSGRLAADLLEAMAGAPPERYLILEVSADLRERQARLLAERVPALADRVEWLDRLPAGPLRGILLANEVLDALPVERFRIGPTGPVSLGVSLAGERLVAASGPCPPAMAAAITALNQSLDEPLPGGYTSEICLRLPAWLAATGRLLGTGLAVLADYGGSRREIYHPERSAGTLACHYRHRRHDDPFLWPGLQDITAWVNFSAVAAAARSAGLAVAGYGTQAHFLLGTGLLEAVAGGPGGAVGARLAAEARQLLMPGEMGERFKVMLLTAGDCRLPDGLFSRDLGKAL